MNKKIIDNIVWYIPIKKLRNSLRNFLLIKDKENNEINQKLDYIMNEIYTIKGYFNLNDDRRKEIFSEIYKHNYWNNNESRSGSGSTLNATKLLRDDILKVINKYKIKTFLDAPCGDMNWMKEIVNNFDYYIGVDIVEDMINNHKNTFSNYKNIGFKCIDITKDELPEVDLIFSRDGIQHLPNHDIIKFIDNIKRSKSKYLLIGTTPNINNYDRNTSTTYNWQYVDLESEPFNFPKALEYIEDYYDGDASYKDDDNLMGLYRISELNLQTRPDQTRPDQTRPDQTRPDQTRPDQTRPDQTYILICEEYIYINNIIIINKLQPMLQYKIAA